MLSVGGDEDGEAREASGRRCATRNVWPLKQVEVQVGWLDSKQTVIMK